MESSGIGAYGVLDVTHADRSITAQRALELALGGGTGQGAAAAAGAGYGGSSGSNLPARGSHGDLASASTADGEAGHRDTPLMLDCVGNFRGELQAESRQALAGLSSVGRSSGQALAAAAAAIAAGGGETAHPVAMRPAAASNASGPQSPCPPKHAGRVTLRSGAGVGSHDAAAVAAAGAGGAGVPRSRGRTVSAAGGADAADAGAGPSYQGALPYEAKDISRALLIMLSNNIGQLAYLNAVRYNCKHVYFVGNFLRHENTIAMRTLALAVAYWSGSKMEGLFLRHEGYCGALGAFLSTLETVGEGGAAEGGGSAASASASDE
jgi:hypothetical protein